MGCWSCGDGNSNKPSVTGFIPGTKSMVLSHGQCEGVTIDLLSMYLRMFECIKKTNRQDKIQATKNEILNFEGKLKMWIAAKEVEPKTCEYMENLPLIQSMVNRIVSKGLIC